MEELDKIFKDLAESGEAATKETPAEEPINKEVQPETPPAKSEPEPPAQEGDEVDEPENEEDEIDWEALMKEAEGDGDGPTVEPAEEPNLKELFEPLKEVVGEEELDVDKLKEFVSNLKKENEELKQKALDNPLDNLPDELKEAIDVARDNPQDYLDFLNIAAIDYSKVDPVALAESEIKQYFTDADGNFDAEGYYEYIDAIPAKELEIRGKQRLAQLQQEQQARKSEFLRRLEAKKANEENAIKDAVRGLDKVAGFKVSDSLKTDLLSSMSGGKYVDALIPKDSNGNIDYGELAKRVFISKHFDKLVKVLTTTASNSTKKHIISAIGNHKVQRPADKSAHKPGDVTDPLDLLIQQSKKVAEENMVIPPQFEK